jgi:hypothetical protein
MRFAQSLRRYNSELTGWSSGCFWARHDNKKTTFNSLAASLNPQKISPLFQTSSFNFELCYFRFNLHRFGS